VFAVLLPFTLLRVCVYMRSDHDRRLCAPDVRVELCRGVGRAHRRKQTHAYIHTLCNNKTKQNKNDSINRRTLTTVRPIVTKANEAVETYALSQVPADMSNFSLLVSVSKFVK
jgi:hypothetical protein